MTDEIAYHNGLPHTVVAGEKVDLVLMAWLRANLPDGAIEDAVAFAKDRSTSKQFGILMRHMAGREPTGISHLANGVERMDGVITAHIHLNDRTSWRTGLLEMRGQSLPETVVNAAPGMSLRRIVDHPLLPDVPIHSVTVDPDGRYVRIDTGT